MYPSTSTQQPAAICALKSPADAIHILEAVRLGLVPRVTRRLTGHERSMIRPGTVWVWEEEETNMRRWTDGRRWGASRVGGGGFLVYTESSDNLSPPPSRSDRPGSEYMGQPGYQPYTGRSSQKLESLIKQTYSTTMTHPITGKAKKFHVVAYSSKHNPQGDANNPLPLPHQLPLLASLKITPGIWPEWEHRRDADYNARRAASYPPPPHGQSAPVTAVASPDGPYPYRARSPQRDHYPSRDPYTGRLLSEPGEPHPSERYRQYREAYRDRPYGAPPPSSSATSSSSNLPIPSTPDSFYGRDPRDARYPYDPPIARVSPPNHSYQHTYTDPYGRSFARGREPYGDDAPPAAPYYDQSPRSPEQKIRDQEDNSHSRHHSAPTHLAPPSMEPPQNGGKSPKMSIGSTILNPTYPIPSTPSSAAPTSNGPTGGLTLPPLRLAIDERNGSSGKSAGNSPSGYSSHISPRTISPGSNNNGNNSTDERPVKGEDARQLGELGKRVSL